MSNSGDNSGRPSSVSDDNMDDISDDDGDDITIATHFVKVRRSGALSDVSTLWDLMGTEAISGSLDALDRPGFDRLPSINAFDKVRGLQVFVCFISFTIHLFVMW